MESSPLKDFVAKVTSSKEALKLIEESEPRIVRAYKELLEGYEEDINVLNVTVEEQATGESGVVMVGPVYFMSICGHHMLPYFGEAWLGYKPRHIVTGLGKIPRLIRLLSRRFTIQEHLTREMVSELERQINPISSLAITEATHLCMCSRGPLAINAKTKCRFSSGEESGIRELESVIA